MDQKKSYYNMIKDGADDATKTGKKLKFDTVDSGKLRIKRLEKIIKALDTAFHIKGDDCIDPFSGEVITDNEYDALKIELFNLSPKSKIFTGVTAATGKIAGDKVIHDPPMTSINKCNGTEKEKEDILNKFFKDCRKIDTNINGQKSYHGWLAKFFCMSFKMDGIALSLKYENGILVSAGLRSDGESGLDVTDKTFYIQDVPQKLPLPLTCIIRGEVYTDISTFNKINDSLPEKDKKANARAYTAGNMNHKKTSKMKDKGLRFTAYNILKLKDTPYLTEIERAEWAEKVLKLNFVKTISFSHDKLETFESQHRRLNHMVDGVVVSINDLQLQAEMGNNGDKALNNPRGKIAWKFADEIKEAVVTSIEWNCGRSGKITPVLIFEKGVDLESTVIHRCTAHNIGLLKENKIGIGSLIEIIKSGKIIPKMHRVVEAKGSANIPTACPSCKGPIEEIEGQNGASSLVCDNDQCPAQNIKNLNHWFKILGVKGIAEKNIEKLIDAGVVQKPGDFYRLTVDGLISNGFTKRTAILIVARVWMVKAPENIKDNDILIDSIKEHQDSGKIKVGMGKFFAAFGMQAAGKSAGEILEKEIGDWSKIKTSTISDLEVFDGIGPVMAQEIVSFFQKNKDMIEDVEQYFEFETKVAGDKLEGKSFCLSGSMEMGKAYWKSQIEAQGGVCKSSVGKKLDYLIAGDGSGNKSIKAESYGISILTEEDLEAMLSS